MTGSSEWRKYASEDKNFINLKQFEVGTKLYSRLKERKSAITARLD